MAYEALFEPITIGDVEIKNRIAMAPMNMVYSDPEGYNSEQWLAWYAARAKGGFGLIITDCVVVNPFTWRASDHLNPHLFLDERYGRGLGVLADNIHAFGAKVFLQISPGFGRQGHASALTPHEPPGAPSAIPIKIDIRNFNKGWFAQVKKMRPELAQILDAIGGVEGLQNLTDEEYTRLEDAIVPIMRQKDPGMVKVVYGEVPRELEIAEIVYLEERMADAAFDTLHYGFDGVEPARLPHPPVPLQPLQPAPRRVRRLAREQGEVPDQYHPQDPRAHRAGRRPRRALLGGRADAGRRDAQGDVPVCGARGEGGPELRQCFPGML
jgi:2,4-dienoyl-CoA reductase-like NADH-dependent reductase (Old Yellow Enzyme family)